MCVCVSSSSLTMRYLHKCFSDGKSYYFLESSSINQGVNHFRTVANGICIFAVSASITVKPISILPLDTLHTAKLKSEIIIFIYNLIDNNTTRKMKVCQRITSAHIDPEGGKTILCHKFVSPNLKRNFLFVIEFSMRTEIPFCIQLGKIDGKYSTLKRKSKSNSMCFHLKAIKIIFMLFLLTQKNGNIQVLFSLINVRWKSLVNDQCVSTSDNSVWKREHDDVNRRTSHQFPKGNILMCTWALIHPLVRSFSIDFNTAFQ